MLKGDTIGGVSLTADTKIISSMKSGLAKEIQRIGNWVSPRSCVEVINEGYRVAATI